MHRVIVEARLLIFYCQWVEFLDMPYFILPNAKRKSTKDATGGCAYQITISALQFKYCYYNFGTLGGFALPDDRTDSLAVFAKSDTPNTRFQNRAEMIFNESFRCQIPLFSFFARFDVWHKEFHGSRVSTPRSHSEPQRFK